MMIYVNMFEISRNKMGVTVYYKVFLRPGGRGMRNYPFHPTFIPFNCNFMLRSQWAEHMG